MRIRILCLMLMIYIKQGKAVVNCPPECLCNLENNGVIVDCQNRNLVSIFSLPMTSIIIILSNNELSFIAKGAFDNLHILQGIFLNNNRLSVIENGMFNDLSSLQVLHLEDNVIKRLDVGAFRKLPALRELSINNNKLSVIEEGTFYNLTALRQLYLFSNQIQRLDVGAFKNLPALEDLYLYDNSLSGIERGTFDNLPALRNLPLGTNPLECNCSILAFYEWAIGSFATVSARCEDGISVTDLPREHFNQCSGESTMDQTTRQVITTLSEFPTTSEAPTSLYQTSIMEEFLRCCQTPSSSR